MNLNFHGDILNMEFLVRIKFLHSSEARNFFIMEKFIMDVTLMYDVIHHYTHGDILNDSGGSVIFRNKIQYHVPHYIYRLDGKYLACKVFQQPYS